MVEHGGVRVRRHATHAGRVEAVAGWVGEAERASGRPTDGDDDDPSRRPTAREPWNGMEGNKTAEGHAGESAGSRFSVCSIPSWPRRARAALRLLVLGPLLLAMGDRQGTSNGPAAHHGGERDQDQPNAFAAAAADARARSHTQTQLGDGEHSGAAAAKCTRSQPETMMMRGFFFPVLFLVSLFGVVLPYSLL